MHPGAIPTFGEPAERYRERRGAYGVAFERASVLLVRWRGGLHLPGGGLHDGEEPRAALERELVEEAGLRVVAADPLCRANAFHRLADGSVVLKAGTFFIVTVEPTGAGPADGTHEPVWVPVAEAFRAVIDDAGAYAIGQGWRHAQG